MGDLSTEPSMEEILSSIKRIIAEDGEGAAPRGRRAPATTRAAVPAAPVADRDTADDDMADLHTVLELSDPMPADRQPDAAPAAAAPAAPTADPIVSTATAQASRDSLGALSRLVVKPEPPSDGTLESMVRDMLRPMMREWLDANLPRIVEQMVAREISKITGA